QCGCIVSAVLGSTQKTAQAAAKNLFDLFGIEATPYHRLENLVKEEAISAISICTPSALHEAQTRFCLENNLSVLCEKPLTYRLDGSNAEGSRKLFALAEKKKSVLSVNTQWPAVLPQVRSEIGSQPTRSFGFHMESGLTGTGLLMDALPHANSMLIGLCGAGTAQRLAVRKVSESAITVVFDYDCPPGRVKVQFELVFNANTPRNLFFAVNDREFRRVVLEKYAQALQSDGRLIPIEDPLRVSIRRFVNAVQDRGSVPLIPKESVLHNAVLTDQVLKEYLRERG
ncbi:MAG: Gfo/Idh/MocA family oxidoreductase, partial [Candidatus Diapherotrites archaeon]|nr:Gfo/Idh/MocA family oxidoreductase [Candidatus Diapherotrites archaeon]